MINMLNIRNKNIAVNSTLDASPEEGGTKNISCLYKVK